MVYDKALNIYADGSSYSHPRRGGMGIRCVTINSEGDEVVQSEEIPGHEGASNNEMELQACIKGTRASGSQPRSGDAESDPAASFGSRGRGQPRHYEN